MLVDDVLGAGVGLGQREVAVLDDGGGAEGVQVFDGLRGEDRGALVQHQVVGDLELFAEPDYPVGLGDLEMVDGEHGGVWCRVGDCGFVSGVGGREMTSRSDLLIYFFDDETTSVQFKGCTIVSIGSRTLLRIVDRGEVDASARDLKLLIRVRVCGESGYYFLSCFLHDHALEALLRFSDTTDVRVSSKEMTLSAN